MKSTIARLGVLLVLVFVLLPVAQAAAKAGHDTVSIQGRHFMRDGRPWQIRSGSIHFQRVPRAYWHDRLEKARAMGLNTVTTYVFWNAIERRRGHFDFSGRNDVAAFVRAAQKVGLSVILRPGPYVCAEWDAGGLPAWLFSGPAVRVRTLDPRFMKAVRTWFGHLGQQLAPLMAAHGGSIIAVQIENEYGAYGHSRAYMRAVRKALVRAGLGSNLLFTSDGPQFMHNDALKGVLAVVNFGPGHAREAFKALAAMRPDEPLMAGEYWDGWYDKWGGPHAHTNARQQANELAWMMAHGDSFNLYMFEGGTSFGFSAGANVVDPPGQPPHYVPLTTSYDYDAPLDEAGRPTAKFWMFRKAIEHATHRTPPAMPPATPFMRVPRFQLDESASLWDNLPAPVHVHQPMPMAHFGQARGYILYRTHVIGPIKGRLDLGKVRDYAVVYVDKTRKGVVDRRLRQTGMTVDIPAGRHELDVLVENSGRVNYGPHLADGRAGLVAPVHLAGRLLSGWDVYPLPMRSPQAIHGWTHHSLPGPAFHRGHFKLAHVADTFWDMRAFHKGFAWVDGHNLGRIWDIGPQRTLYQPAPWLRQGTNTAVVFDLDGIKHPVMKGVEHEIWKKNPG